jgi:hypothetical protein
MDLDALCFSTTPTETLTPLGKNVAMRLVDCRIMYGQRVVEVNASEAMQAVQRRQRWILTALWFVVMGGMVINAVYAPTGWYLLFTQACLICLLYQTMEQLESWGLLRLLEHAKLVPGQGDARTRAKMAVLDPATLGTLVAIYQDKYHWPMVSNENIAQTLEVMDRETLATKTLTEQADAVAIRLMYESNVK